MLWKLYFGILSLFVVPSICVTVVQGPHAIYPVADYLIQGLTVAQLVGLYGYAFRQPLLSQRAWQIAFPVFVLNFISTLVIASIRFAAAKPDYGMTAAATAILIFGLPFFLPLLLADRRYAFHSTLWR
ncbi:hypothetical protein [Bradyrhizobium liaoningense]|uniref:hypothetical protein n=1 Tax=Bradyrhizobium liaoningense TaxID=43992 RepID=UPI001BA57A17|nr:hypothetical protein [Bradyrhizobium liaoningense]MBR0719900.1 hypothetical protein [Bradyrhizobium liaoningense]